MPVSITVPRLGWNMEEGIFAGWLKQDGDTVRPGDTLFSLESDKATEDVESLDSGILRIPPDGPRVGDRLPVGQVIAYLVQPGEAVPGRADLQQSRSEAKIDNGEAKKDLPAGPAARRLARELGVDLQHVAASDGSGRVTAEDVRQHHSQSAKTTDPPSDPTISPRARRVAAELNVDWTHLRGSGKTGRIRERDVRAAAERSTAAAGRSVSPRSLPRSATRRVIAERMLHSARSTAPVTLTTQADATNLVNLRGQFQAAGQSAADPVPGYTDFFVKLTAVALEQHPYLCVRWEEGRLVAEEQIHIGIAVDTAAGLLVPVVRDVRGLGLRQLAARSRDLIERARLRKLSAEEMQGGTFTVSSLGAYGIDAFSPVINYPEIAILGVGRIRRQPVAVGEQFVVRDMVTLSLTFDHCAVDGAPAARFLQSLCKVIEAPGPWLMS
jgi:pyruvate dehydrogenase E2 component (dihydrolipoyllysine-residue acetyltransferase)